MNRSESRETNSHINGQLLFDKGAKRIHWGKNSLFNNNAGTTGYPRAKK